jgi:hypothetical protein
LESATVCSAAGNDPISTATAVRTGYNIIETTGLFTASCRDWSAKVETDKMFPVFQTSFRDADLDRRRTATTETAGCHSAYQAVAAPHEPAEFHNAYQATAAPPPLIHRTPASARLPATYTYCWSHGGTTNISHTSMSCQNNSNSH